MKTSYLYGLAHICTDFDCMAQAQGDGVDDWKVKGRDRLGDIERGDDRDVETQEAVVALVAGWLYKDSGKTSRCGRIT